MAESDDGLIPLGPPAPAARSDNASTGDDGLRSLSEKPILSTSYEKLPTSLARGVVLGARNAVEGGTSLPMTALDAATWPARAVLNLFPGEPTPAPSTMLQRGLNALGAPEARTPEEQRNASIIRGGSAMLTPMGVGTALPNVAARVPAMVRPLVATAPVASTPLAASQVAAGGVGALAGDTLADSEIVPPWLKPSARLAGGMLGAGGVSALTGAAGTIANAVRGNLNPVAEALQRLGITPRTVGAVSQRPGVQETEAAFSGVPMASGQLQPAQRQMVNEFGDAVHGTAQRLDPTTAAPIMTAQQAGEVAQRELLNWKNNTFPAQQAAVWNPLSQRMAGSAVNPSAYRTALENTARDPALNTLPETQRAFLQNRLQTWLDALNTDVPRGGNMTWEQAMAVKRRIGDVMGTPDAVSDVGGTALKNVYGSLAGDMRTTAVQHGQEALFDAANHVTTEGHQFLTGTASKAVRANNPMQETIRPDTAARSLLEDNTGMRQLRDRVPVAADALAAWKLRDMMTPVASSQGDVSTGSFLTNLRKQARSDPEGQAALFADPAVAQNVRDLATVADQFRSVERNANVSKTAKTGAILGTAGAVGSGYGMGGVPGALTALAGSVGAPWLTGKVLTSPTAIRLAAAQPGPRPPIDPRVAGLLGYLANDR